MRLTRDTAGQLNLEIVATDFQGHSSAERFFVTMPVQPPPDPAAPEKPNFNSVKLFREEYGLDREHPLSKSEMNDLVLELLYEWEAQRPTAVASVDTWGAPMRAPELAEMEYRKQYTTNSPNLFLRGSKNMRQVPMEGFTSTIVPAERSILGSRKINTTSWKQ